MRLVFAGTPLFARAALIALADAGHEIVAVLTQPDRASGRGLELLESPVKQQAKKLGLAVLQPSGLQDGKPGANEAKRALTELAPDLMVVAAYGLLLPRDVLHIPRLGCLNIHASLLPRWRGAAPIQRAIEAGDDETGISLMQMEEGLDTGPVWSFAKTAISEADHFQSLHDRLSMLGASEVVRLLADFPPKGVSPTPQPQEGITYAKKITKQDARLDWGMPARQVADKIRSLDPAPGAQAVLAGEVVKLFDARLVGVAEGQPLLKKASPGQILLADATGLWVACGQGAVCIGAVQRPGAKRLAIREFLNGRPVTAGQSFGSLPGLPA